MGCYTSELNREAASTKVLTLTFFFKVEDILWIRTETLGLMQEELVWMICSRMASASD